MVFVLNTQENIPDSSLKRAGSNPMIAGFSSQQLMVVHYPRTVSHNSYAEHKGTGKHKVAQEFTLT